MKFFPISALLLAILATKVNGQPKAGQAQPDRIVFDKVHVGATVEDSFLVFAAPVAGGEAKFEVTAPHFVRV